jgi:hypothetical protein
MSDNRVAAALINEIFRDMKVVDISGHYFTLRLPLPIRHSKAEANGIPKLKTFMPFNLSTIPHCKMVVFGDITA